MSMHSIALRKECRSSNRPFDYDVVGWLRNGDIVVVVGDVTQTDEWEEANTHVISRVGLGWIDVSVLEKIA